MTKVPCVIQYAVKPCARAAPISDTAVSFIPKAMPFLVECPYPSRDTARIPYLLEFFGTFRHCEPSGELPSNFPLHRYPKDIWPGHKPPNHTVGAGEANGVGGEEEEEEQLEFFCDACDETIPNGVERMECAVCPDEFCLCHRCYDEGEVRGTAVVP